MGERLSEPPIKSDGAEHRMSDVIDKILELLRLLVFIISLAKIEFDEEDRCGEGGSERIREEKVTEYHQLIE